MAKGKLLSPYIVASIVLLTASAAVPQWTGGIASAQTQAESRKTMPNAKLDLIALDRARILADADKYLNEKPVTVTAFPAPRSAGGIHDFSSEGDYWWPNPSDPNGPYIQRDGETNPDNFVAHRHAMIRMDIQVATLTAAYKLTGDKRYAGHAIEHLKAWFVDPATKMNPNLQYAQSVKGVTPGRGTGIIDTLHLVEAARSVTVLERGGALKGNDLTAIKQWFADYLTWMTTSKNGMTEMNAKNNHGTCWAVQAAEFASLTGNQQEMQTLRDRYKQVLLPSQMAPDGSFPQELRRTKPYSYSLFNLDAMTTLCQILSTPQDNLWNYTTPDGRGIRKGVEFLYPYIKDKSKWPYKHDVMFWEQWPVRSPSLLFAGLAYGDQDWLAVWQTLDPAPTNDEVIRNVPIRTPLLWVD